MVTAAELKANVAYATDKGVKERNEDFAGAIIPDEPQLTHKGITAAIADGMSGSDAGQQASQCCIASLLCDYYCTPDSWSVKQAVQKVLAATNSWLYSQGQRRYQSTKGMVSTLSAIVIKSTTAHIFHIGDSRIYRLRKGNLEQITRDHRIWLSKEQNYLNRAIGIEPRLEVDYKAIPLEHGDLFLLTTDGVHDFIDEKTLSLLLEEPDLDMLAEKIIQTAKANQSDDNLTCQLLRIDNLPEAREDEILRRHANLPFPPPLKSGMVIDDYRIEAELYASKRTQIYRALDTQTGKPVILKTPSILYDDDAQYIEHFLQEEWAGKRINHQNVVKVLNIRQPKSCVYYVTEYVEGLTLREWIKAYPKADIGETRKIVAQIAQGLRAFHRKEMLHQDLKPENILLDKQGAVKIIDFGSVKIAGIAEMAPLANANEPNLFGTLNYAAPEYHLGQAGSTQSDLYSLAVITYEMLNGALPFDKPVQDKPNPLYFANRRYIPSFQRNPMVPFWIDGALKKALSISPAIRYEALSEFIHDINHPNQAFLRAEDKLPLLESNPLRFWQVLAAILVITNLLLLYILFG